MLTSVNKLLVLHETVSIQISQGSVETRLRFGAEYLRWQSFP